jgi:hypothetical protein
MARFTLEEISASCSCGKGGCRSHIVAPPSLRACSATHQLFFLLLLHVPSHAHGASSLCERCITNLELAYFGICQQYPPPPHHHKNSVYSRDPRVRVAHVALLRGLVRKICVAVHAWQRRFAPDNPLVVEPTTLTGEQCVSCNGQWPVEGVVCLLL